MAAKFSRRDFLKVTVGAAGAAGAAAVLETILNVTGNRQTVLAASEGSIKISSNDVIVAGACSLCPSACGTLARVADGNVVKLEGKPMHPINSGSLCPKGRLPQNCSIIQIDWMGRKNSRASVAAGNGNLFLGMKPSKLWQRRSMRCVQQDSLKNLFSWLEIHAASCGRYLSASCRPLVPRILSEMKA